MPEWIVREDLVDDEGGAVVGAAFAKRGQLGSRHRRAGRIVRAHGKHRAHFVRPRLVNRCQVDRPSAVVLEPVWHRPHAVEASQVIEQRVARRRHKHRVADRTTEQFEAPGYASLVLAVSTIRSGCACVPRRK